MIKHHCLRYVSGLFLLLGWIGVPAMAVDLVYVPIEPCRIADTRLTIGAIPADSSVNLIAYGGVGELTGQGGSAGGCPNPKPGSTPVSIAANITVVGNQASGNGNLVAYPYGSPLPAVSLVNYKVGTNVANASIIALCEGATCTYDFNLQSNFSAVPAIVDVQGYFYPKSMKNVITVSAQNADFTSPIDAINAIPTTGPDVPSATNPYLIQIGPDTYNLGNNQLIMREWVDIKGTGSREATVITGAVSSFELATSAVVRGANNAELTDLTIINIGGGSYAVAIYNNTASPNIRRVKAIASGGGTWNWAIYNENASPIMSNVRVEASGADNNVGISSSLASPKMKEFTAVATGGNSNVAIHIASDSTSLFNVVARSSGGASSNYGIYHSWGTADIQFSTLEGGLGGYGLWTVNTANPNVSSSKVIGGAAGITTNNSCIYVADENNNPLDANCQPIP